MKKVLSATDNTKITRLLLVPVAFCIALLISGNILAQSDSTVKKETPAAEETSLIAPSIEFISVQKADNTIDLKANLKAKFKGSFIKLPLLKVTFLQVSDSAEKELGFVITDVNGKAVFNVKSETVSTDKEGKMHFKAVFAGNKSMDAAEEELTIKKARLEMSTSKGDSSLSVNVKLIDVGSGTEVPVKEAALGIFIKRSFYPLKVGEGTTNENGEAAIEISNSLPGDAKGTITLMARLDENELYGNLEASDTKQFGVAVSDKNIELPRALWSSHPPLWMLITFIILVSAVWGHYIVIIYELFRLRKEEPNQKTETTSDYN